MLIGRRLLAALGMVSAAFATPSAATETGVPSAQGESWMETGTEAGFAAWVAGFRVRALAAGITGQTFDDAFRDARFDPAVVEKDRNQSEFTKAIWDYLDSAVSDERVAKGQAALQDNLALLERIEATYGVDKQVVVAVWGLESAYGTYRGTYPLIGTLATLAFDGRRGAFFEGQLLAALTILQNGDVDAAAMTGSWAGAMGHTQFIPTSYLAHAVDFTGDGRRDIWSDDPADALASTAAYLANAGWQTGRPWGVEVTLPPGFDYGDTGERVKKPVARWQALGVRTAEGGALPDHGPASVLLPAGARGAAFLVFANFGVIERYNAADAYVIGVGHLADRIAGAPPIRAAWPRQDRVLSLDERVELQRRLAAAGFDPGVADGKIGPNTIAAVRAFQRSIGAVPDGYASLGVLQKLR
ncbi:MAG: lytic murein transglycosylase [Rhodobacter sp.]|nr:lytic murein transglycosylase [Rhodobacter sp.]MCA3511787.1 lytic murein transglycosylase [Rhodobacter sp.]MCA3520621.1 lytic murein transglycosylase [Rhodobacter sp.]MCA3524144.1 lytic murein transglycosylase [Rhodobacter sp.]MCA3526183.1 lytic murein transglycosylase [Rhodobacter sp.]